MAQKFVELPGIGRVLLAKRRGSRTLRLTIRPDGGVRVGLPSWAPYATGVRFALDRADWIKQHQSKIDKPLLRDGDRVGKSFRIIFTQDTSKKTASSRIVQSNIRIISPYTETDSTTQSVATKAAERALKTDANKLLKIRLDTLAAKHGFIYSGFKVKKLRSRWGSCSSQKDITLNIFLIQLPWDLIDYVLLHELSHTEHMNHGPAFWQRLTKAMPDAKKIRKSINAYRPDITVA
jgi:predicted metal-dependent hydrolase